MLAFISRLWGFRHVNFAVQDKPFVLALTGMDLSRGTVEEDFCKVLKPFRVAEARALPQKEPHWPD